MQHPPTYSPNSQTHPPVRGEASAPAKKLVSPDLDKPASPTLELHSKLADMDRKINDLVAKYNRALDSIADRKAVTRPHTPAHAPNLILIGAPVEG